MSTNHITMKLTDIDLSSLAEVAAAITLLDSVHVRLATGGVPLPSLPPVDARCDADLPESFVPGTRTFVVNPAQVSEAQLPGFGFPATSDITHMGDTQAAQPLDAATVFGRVTPGPGEYDPLPGAPAQSAAPLPQLAPCTAAAAPSPTAPAAPPASGLAPLASPAPAPQPVASAAAPTASAAPSSPAGGVELDADGLPWDERIHAGTKRKNADGRWTAKRGINDPDLVPRVVAQLRAQMAAGGVVTPQPAAPAPLAALTSATPAPLLGGKPTPTTFADFMTAATVEVQRGTMTAVEFGQACEPFGGAKGLAANPAAIPMAWAALKAQHPGML